MTDKDSIDASCYNCLYTDRKTDELPCSHCTKRGIFDNHWRPKKEEEVINVD